MTAPVTMPQNATVLTLRGLNRPLNALDNWLSGLFQRPGYTIKPIEYPASSDPASISTGKQMFDYWVKNTPGFKIGVGQSQGAQALTHWLLDNDGTVPADELAIVLTGNPLRNPTGRLVGGYEFGGTIGVATPTDTKYWVIDVARRRDPWAFKSGWFVNWWGSMFVHPFYEKVDIYAPGNRIAPVDNTLFITTD